MKKSLKALLLAMILVMVPVASFAAGSTSTTSSRSNSSNASSHSSSSGGGGGGSSSSSSGSSGTVVAGSGSSSSSSTSSGIVETTYTTVTNGAGDTLNVGATYTRLSDGVVTALVGEVATDEIEAENPSTAYVAVGISKTAGLPEYVKTLIAQWDAGDLSGTSGVDLSGYRTYGTSVAVRCEAGSTATIYCSDLPENVTKILFYDNWMEGCSLIDCTVDEEAGTVTFTVSTSGTAVIVGY